MHKESMQLLHMYCLKHNMQGGAAQKHTSIHIEYKMKNNNHLFWCWNRNIFHENLAKTIAANDLGPCVVNTSAAMLLIT